MTKDLPYCEGTAQHADTNLPTVSIILPFEPKMVLKRELEYQLQRVADKVQKKLSANYMEEEVRAIMSKLRRLIKTLNFSTYKKSIAIVVSPLAEKVFYLDIAVEEKVTIDEPFEIRDLVYSKKDIHKYLVLVLSSERSQLFLGNTTKFFRLVFNTPQHVAGSRHDYPERIGNFSDPSAHKEGLLHKFLHHIDNGLGIILNAYNLPLFVMATERVMGHFKKITRYANHITGYVHGNFEDASESAIRTAIAPHVLDWKKVKEDDLVLRLEEARHAGKIAIGMPQVREAAMQQRGRLLVVEKNYTGDAVDDVIEKVLQNGGDVEFVDEGLLKNYQQIALIQYY